MKRSALGWLVLLLALFMMSAFACGRIEGGGEETGGGATTTATGTPASVTLGTTQASVLSDNSDSATITATVLDANSAVVEGVGVTFNASSGQLLASIVFTDPNGQATVGFSSGTTDQSNRVATITASASGASSAQLPIQITGSTLQALADFTNLSVGGAAADLEITARNAGSTPVYNTPITLSASPAGILSFTPASGNTLVDGTFDALVSGVAAGTATVTAQGLGATATQTFTVTAAAGTFEITSPATSPATLDTTSTLTVTVSAPTQLNVIFATTLGVWDGGAASVVTKAVAAGTVSAVLSSAEAGLANVQVFDAADTGTSDSLTVAISAPSSQASQIALQSSSSVVAPSVGGVSNTVNLTATVRNALDQPVGNAQVAFLISNTTGGGESVSPAFRLTDSSGRAQATFASGTLPSDAQGVRVTATVVGTALSDFVDIVIGGTAGSVVIGQSTTISSINANTAYSLPMSVLVADGNGNPIPQASVSLKLWPLQYSIGVWGVDNIPIVFADFDNEDANRNLILDAGEDANSDSELTPPNSAAGTVPQSVQTDDNGVVNFNLVYLKSSAVWIIVELKATTLVLGTETSATTSFRLPYLQGDEAHLADSPYSAPEPIIGLSRTSITTSTTSGTDAGFEQFEISNPGIGTLQYAITTSQAWVVVNPTPGSATTETDTITVTFPGSGALAAGTYTATITVSDNGSVPAAGNSPQSISVTLTVN